MPRRLFIFAAYDAGGMVGPSLLWYLEALSRCGDIVLAADTDFRDGELEKLKGLCLHAEGCAHGEYDFGSYKRGWRHACSSLDMRVYDFVYLVNDSVFGPLYDLSPYLERMEGMGCQAFALGIHPGRHSTHLQSWFMGFGREVFTSSWFGSFLLSVERQGSKEDVCEKYESGLTRLLSSGGISFGGLYSLPGKSVYNSPYRLYRRGFPFVKKSAFTRHGGSLGRQLRAVLDGVPDGCRNAVLEDASRLYGREYVGWLLSCSPSGAAWRYLRYLFRKVFSRP